MSFFGDIGNAVSSVVHTAEDAVGTVAHTAEDVAGEALKIGEGAVSGAIGTVVSNPLNLLNPFAVVSGAAQGAFGAISGHEKAALSPFTDITKLINGQSDGLDDIGGGSIVAILMQLASKERGRLADKVNALKNLQAPGTDATPQQNQDYESTKANLMADIQTLQNTISQITTMATNVEKTDNDTNMAIVRNLA